MASYRGHLFTSTGLGIAYAGLSIWQLHVDWPIAAVGGLLCAVGGLLPDLDSDSGVPVREMMHLAAALAPILLLRRMASYGLSHEQTFLACAGVYCFVRFILFNLFRKITVHRGMYHSIPAMLIAGLVVFLACEHPDFEVRSFLAVGIMIGFLSHLVLDELCSVDINGVVPKLNSFAGTAVKFYSPSKSATLFTYSILAGLSYLAYGETHNAQAVPPGSTIAQHDPNSAQPVQRPILKFLERPNQADGLRWKPAAPKENRPVNVPLSIPPG
ncbi:MAG: metal-dependent hydrolase [Gemmataceae bacterium]